MPFTARQRRFFHAAAERGEKGMSSLADEADSLAKSGDERAPIHKAMGGTCYACGGMVDESGMAAGGDVDDDYAAHDEDAETEQHEAGEVNEDNGRRGFVRAVRRGAGR